MQESIFSSAMRSFLKAFFSIAGLMAGFIAVFALLSLQPDSTATFKEPERIYTPEIVANADGIREKVEGQVPVILQLNIHGIIGNDKLNMNTFRTQLMESREGAFENNPPKALLLNIASPGGTVTDADGIYRAIKSYKEKYNIPVYAYVDGLCASGGMYIAAAADKIYASDVSLVGSVGVISPAIFNYTKTMEKIGVEAVTLFAGIGKDELNSFRPWGPNEAKSYQSIIDTYYDHFVQVISSNRKNMDKSKLVKLYGAQIFSAQEAAEFGFIDEAGITSSETIRLLAKTIDAQDNQYQVVQLDKKNWVSELFGSNLSLFRGQMKHRIDFGSELTPDMMNQFLYLYRP